MSDFLDLDDPAVYGLLLKKAQLIMAYEFPSVWYPHWNEKAQFWETRPGDGTAFHSDIHCILDVIGHGYSFEE